MNDYAVMCEHNVSCHQVCPFHCDMILKARTLAQAILLKHTHITGNETHVVEIRKEGTLVNLEKAGGW